MPETEEDRVEEFRQWILNNLDFYENHLLIHVVFYPVQSNRLLLQLNTRIETGRRGKTKYFQDFQDNQLNRVVRAAKELYNYNPEVVQQGITPELLFLYLRRQEGNGDLLDGEAMMIQDKITAILVETAHYINLYDGWFGTNYFRFWLGHKRMRFLANNAADVADTFEQFEVVMNRSKSVGVNQYKGTVSGSGDGLQRTDDIPDQAKMISLPWRGMNIMLGGGLFRGDYTVMGASSGVGKTAAAAQISGFVAWGNQTPNGFSIPDPNVPTNKVLLCSTEENAKALSRRVLSYITRTRYDLFVPFGLDLSAQPPDKQEYVRACISHLDKNLKYLDWAKEKNPDVQMDLKNCLDRMAGEEGFVPDLLFFDWIGGGMGEMQRRDLNHYRLIMQSTSDFLASLAESMGIHIVATAQIHPSPGYSKRKIMQEHLLDNKTLAKNAANFIGISGLKIGEDNDDEQADFQTDQYLNIDKHRFGTGGCMPVTRNLAFQELLPSRKR